MTAIFQAMAITRRPGWAIHLVAGGAAFLGLVAVRAALLHDGLLYPDGYQYLLMARGIAEHLEPVTTLGPGGDAFVPNADAAVKPFFPALVALASVLGVAPIDAARAVTVIAAAGVPVLVALLALRLGAGRAAAGLAALLCAVSPTLVYWSGYMGPDPLAQVLALGAALSLLHRRLVLGGALAALCLLSHPAYAIVALAALLAGVAAPHLRRQTLRTAGAGVLVLSAVLLTTRPPVEMPPTSAVAGALGVAALTAGLLLGIGRARALVASGVAVLIVGFFALLDGGAWASFARQDWPLLVFAGVGLTLCLRAPIPRAAALRLLALSMPLALAYWVKNPGLERYVAQLVPELSLLAALGLGTLPRARLHVAAAAGALATAGVVASFHPAVGPDASQELAPVLERAPAGTLVTAAPDAYGFLLPERPIRALTEGAEGLVLIDGAARAYAPELRVDGAVVRRITVITGFLRPDGDVDRAPAFLYRGRVTER